MEQAIQIASKDKNISEKTRAWKDYKCQSLLTEARKGENLVAMLPDFERQNNKLRDEIMTSDTQNDISKIN